MRTLFGRVWDPKRAVAVSGGSPHDKCNSMFSWGLGASVRLSSLFRSLAIKSFESPGLERETQNPANVDSAVQCANTLNLKLASSHHLC